MAEPAADSTDAENTSEQTFDENTDVSETPVISEQMLYELYTACLLYTSNNWYRLLLIL